MLDEAGGRRVVVDDLGRVVELREDALGEDLAELRAKKRSGQVSDMVSPWKQCRDAPRPPSGLLHAENVSPEEADSRGEKETNRTS